MVPQRGLWPKPCCRRWGHGTHHGSGEMCAQGRCLGGLMLESVHGRWRWGRHRVAAALVAPGE